jgi:type IV pilus assembly protein PilX
MRHLHTIRAMHRQAGTQRGAALLVALVFLVLLTVLALASSGGSLLQQKMVGATRNAQLAEWGAESALRGAEWRLWTASSSPSTRMKCGETTSLSDCYVFDRLNPNSTVVKFRTARGWITTGATQFTHLNYGSVQTGDASPKLAADPYYIIEDLGIERPPGVGSQHESGSTGTGGAGYTSIERHLYRITARSPGGNMNTVRVVESIFAAKSD